MQELITGPGTQSRFTAVVAVTVVAGMRYATCLSVRVEKECRKQGIYLL